MYTFSIDYTRRVDSGSKNGARDGECITAEDAEVWMRMGVLNLWKERSMSDIRFCPCYKVAHTSLSDIGLVI